MVLSGEPQKKLEPLLVSFFPPNSNNSAFEKICEKKNIFLPVLFWYSHKCVFNDQSSLFKVNKYKKKLVFFIVS